MKPASLLPAAFVVVAVAGVASAADDAPVDGGLHSAVATENCEACHVTDAWQPARFAHDRTGYPLEGGHTRTTCASCHGCDYTRATPTQCAACHQDAHQREFGSQCQGCHTPETWQPLFLVDAHRRTNFPLTGRHGMLACVECHNGVRDRTFTRAATPCIACHQPQFNRAGARVVDHVRSGFSTECRSCHEPGAYRPALFPAHDNCFPILRGVHAFACATCHTTTAGTVANGSCKTGTAACTTCHTHARERTDPIHKKVDGYRYTASRCVACHRSGK